MKTLLNIFYGATTVNYSNIGESGGRCSLFDNENQYIGHGSGYTFIYKI